MIKPVPQLIMGTAGWTLRGYPDPKNEWSDAQKAEAAKKAGFDAMVAPTGSELSKEIKKTGMILLGASDISSIEEVESKLKGHQESGVIHINIQLCDHDTPTEQALPVAIKVIEVGAKLGIKPAIEVHRDTCTETPEKAYALAEAFEKKMGRPLRMNFDFSHPAVIKHLRPNDDWARLVERVDLLVYGELIHFRPFNGHHCQIPVTNGKGNLSPELIDWLPFCDKVIETWLNHSEGGREFVVVPELGPKNGYGGYGLSCFPDIWNDAVILSKEIRKIWDKHIQNWKPHSSAKSKVAVPIKI